MATQIRGSTQIKLKSITFDRLVDDFLKNTTWIASTDNTAVIRGLADPTDPTDAATKHYVDERLNGKSWKAPVRVFADSNVDLSNPPTSIDGVTLATGDRIALFNQTTGSENGVYVYNGSGSALTRAEDWPEGAKAANWTFWVQEGNNYADQEYTVTNNSGSDVVGTDTLTVVQTGGAGLVAAGAGLYRTGNTINVGAADESIEVFPDGIAVKIGNKYGDSLEVTDQGLELSDTIFGTREFKLSEGETFTITGPKDSAFLSCEVTGSEPEALVNVDFVQRVWESVSRVYNVKLTVTPGSNTVQLPEMPDEGTLRVYVNGIRQAHMIDYQVIGDDNNPTIQFTYPLQEGDVVVVDYETTVDDIPW